MIAPPDFNPYFDVNTSLPVTAEMVKGYRCGLDEQVYRQFTGVNSSLLKSATCCEMLHDLTKPRTDDFSTASAAEKNTTGTILHWAVLEPWKFEDKHRDNHMMLCETDGLATKSAQKQRAENPGKLLVTGEYIEKAARCREAIEMHPHAMELLKLDSRKEASGFVFDPRNMIWRKQRLDLFPVNANILCDVKTTAFPLYRFEDEGWTRGYYQQAAWYLDTHFLLTGEWREAFWWIVVTKEEPFMCDTFFMRNLKPSDPLYQDPKCKLRIARERLGLDMSARLGRLQMFCTAARETNQLRERGIKLTRPLMRQTWPGYEQTEPKELI